MERAGVDAAFIANDASWEYLTGLPRGGHDNTKQRQNSLEFACLLVTQKKVTAFCPRLSALGFSWRMEAEGSSRVIKPVKWIRKIKSAADIVDGD